MVNIFVGKSYGGLPTAHLNKVEVNSFESFCGDFLETCQEGKKNEYYVTIGSEYEKTLGDKNANEKSYKYNDHWHRNNLTQLKAWILPFDGDSSVSQPGCCIPPLVVHEALKRLNYNHVIYTTHSHIPGIKNRWRLFIPCEMTSPSQLDPNVRSLFGKLKENGCTDLALANESKTWSIPWYLPTRDDPDDNCYEYYTFFDGVPFKSAEPSMHPMMERFLIKKEQMAVGDIRTPEQLISIICTGGEGLHQAIRDYIFGAIRDGRPPSWVKAELHAFTSNYDLSDSRMKNRKEDIDRMVDVSFDKQNITMVGDDWLKKSQDNDRPYTKYPDQGGVMEDMVSLCMSWMRFPNRQIAVTACHTLMSTLGGRVYTLRSGGGIVLTILVTGRSTIGKSNIKKFCVFTLNNFMLNKVAGEFIGSHYYTSGANLIKEMCKVGSLLSVRTESGQSDQSQAGDMKRVALYELELATESGADGYISSGGQNDKIPDLYSPAVTTVRESVAEIQNSADKLNQVAVSGTSGRRSHVVIDPVKPPPNRNRISKLPDWYKKLIYKMYRLSKDERRKEVEKPLPENAWVYIDFEDSNYLDDKAIDWIKKENEAAKKRDHLTSTFYGRLYERIPSFAARLAIAENPDKPIITNKQIDIAEESLFAEVSAFIKQEQDSDPWDMVIQKIVDIFSGDLMKTPYKSIKNYTSAIMLKAGVIPWSPIRNVIYKMEEFKALKASNPNFEHILRTKLEYNNIIELSKEESVKLFRSRGKLFRRV